MNKKIKPSRVLLSILSSCALLGACSQLTDITKPVVMTNMIKQSANISRAAIEKLSITKLLDTELSLQWSNDFDHMQENLLHDVANAITYYAQQGDMSNQALNKLSYYLRIYTSFGKDKDWPEHTASSLNNALLALQAMPGFYQVNVNSARLHENYAVALYRLYYLEPLQASLADHVKPLSKLIDLYANTDLPDELAVDYALWEILRSAAILPYEARRKNKDIHINAVLKGEIIATSLSNFLTAKNSTLRGDNWPQQHATWALANYYNLYNKQYLNEYYLRSEGDQKKLDDDILTLPVQQKMSELDNTVWSALSSDKSLTRVQIKTQFSIPYVVSTFRGKSECEEGTLANRCITPTIEQTLPNKHVCSASLYILSQEMTEAQLSDSCQQLTAQESSFHEKLATKKQPVANDYNDSLRVVVFENASEYNKFGQLVFDINTDNGGMYIEGTVQDPDNIATFYSYEHFWVRPEFKVWNLNHEYVHYLDGRFIKYDTFNHFPSHMVWWSEGLAEYISKGDVNPKAFKKMADTEQKDWPSLSDVFNTEYKDGGDRVYKWGYLAVRYMYENHQKQYRQLANFLKTDYFSGYKTLLTTLGEKHADSFKAWLVSHEKENIKNVQENENKENKPRQFYRYTYKDYLQPKHLLETSEHMHWQYWHANALKNK
ncbi:MAG: collagenase [Colwellia sp.]|nr:collagenase [Colwellia sp.]